MILHTQLLRHFLLLVLVTATLPIFANSADTITFNITRTGRKILHDGFLMEWRTETTHTWGRDSAWVWDVIATPEGLAGYIRLPTATPCSSWHIGIMSSVDNKEHLLTLPADTTHYDPIFRSDLTEYDSSRTITAEWLFPYREGLPDLKNPMTLTFTGTNSCSDTLPVLLLSYQAQPVRAGTKISLIGQGLIIGFLALLYFSIHRKIKLQTLRQMGSPHQ